MSFFTAECGFYAARRLQRAVTFSGWTVVATRHLSTTRPAEHHRGPLSGSAGEVSHDTRCAQGLHRDVASDAVSSPHAPSGPREHCGM